MALLASARAARLGLSRRDWLKLGAAGAAACAWPTLHFAPADASGAGDDRRAPRGKIYARVIIVDPAPGAPRSATGLFSVDPATGALEKSRDIDGRFSRFNLSRDGRSLALVRYGMTRGARDVDLDGVWTLDAEGQGEMRRVTDFAGSVSWSPDGRQLIVTRCLSEPGDAMRCETWRIDADGSGATRLPIPEADLVEDWSPDGGWLVTVSDRHPPSDRGCQLYLVRPDGTEPRRLTEGPSLNVFPRFSPDGRQIAYHRQSFDGDSIWVVDLDGGSRRPVLQEEDDVFPQQGGWSPDGRSLACTMMKWSRDQEGRKVLGGPGQPDPWIVIVDVDSKERRELRPPHVMAIEWPTWC
jgi:dipeptidyl aminopeptidase/acylaminoacyl peptidase